MRLLLAAAVAVAAGAGIYLALRIGLGDRSRDAGNPWRDLAVAKADYVPPDPPAGIIWRGEGDGAPSEEDASFREAMAPYQGGDPGEAEPRLSRFLESHPAHARAHFYRGVCLLLLDRAAEAVAPLQSAREAAPAALREEASWYLALAHLKAGDASKALGVIEPLISAGGRRAAMASDLRREIRARTGK